MAQRGLANVQWKCIALKLKMYLVYMNVKMFLLPISEAITVRCVPNSKSNITRTHTSYLSRTQGRCPWRKNLSCGEISNFCTWNMWRKLKFLHKWINFKFFHMTDVEKSEISFVVCTIYGILLHFTLFCCKICFFFGDFRCFVAWSFFAIYALLCGEKFSQK